MELNQKELNKNLRSKIYLTTDPKFANKPLELFSAFFRDFLTKIRIETFPLFD